MAITTPTVGQYPTIEDVMQYTRILIVNAGGGATGTVGESRIATEPWTPSIQILNLAMQSLQRDLENYGLPTTREVVFIVNGLPPVNGPQGLGIPDPTVQVYLGFNGFWDGSTLHSSPTLPADLLVPRRVFQRVTNSNTVFNPVANAIDGLKSFYQNYLLGQWEWRQDAIWFNGAQQEMDVQLYYTGGLPKFSINLNPDLWATTMLPWLDSGDALAAKCALLWLGPRGAGNMADYLGGEYDKAMLRIANRWIKTAQATLVYRSEFGGEGGGSAAGDAGSGY